MPRTELRIPSGGETLAAWLFRPEEAGDEPRPAVVMGHGFAGTRHDGLARFAERFATAGLAAVVFDYRHFGDSGGRPRQLLDVGRQHDDFRAVLAHVRAMEGVDASRVALWGSSFGGGHVVSLAAEDPTLAAAVSQAPFMDGLVQMRRVAPVPSARIAALGARDAIAAMRGREPVTMPVVGPPGSVAALTSPESERGYASILGDGSPWRNEVAARVMLRVGAYRPVRRAPHVRCPLLVCACDRDDLTPPEPAVRAAELAPRGELRRYPLGHFDVYVGDGFERVVADQTAFLVRHLRPG